jgi:hypothetical protein
MYVPGGLRAPAFPQGKRGNQHNEHCVGRRVIRFAPFRFYPCGAPYRHHHPSHSAGAMLLVRQSGQDMRRRHGDRHDLAP